MITHPSPFSTICFPVLTSVVPSSFLRTTPSSGVRGSPPLRWTDGRATGTARFQEIQEIALGDANAIHHPHVPQVAASTERVDATSRYSEALGHVANPQKGSRSAFRTWQQMGSKTLRKSCILLQRVGLGWLAKSRDSNNLRLMTTPCQPGLVACHAGGRGFKSRPPRKTPLEKSRGVSLI